MGSTRDRCVKPAAAIVGLGATPYYFRGESHPQTVYELIGKAVFAALGDAGSRIEDVDGFAFFAFGFDTGMIIEQLGIRSLTFSHCVSEAFTTAGAGPVAQRLYETSGIGPKDIDVALIYDHFSPLVIMQLEDFGFCKRGEGGPFVESGAIRLNGAIPVNPHGGHLSEAYVVGMTHIREAVEQLRGTAVNQIKDAKTALVTGGPAPTPMTAAILRNER
jgi:hypothetical protein